MPILFAALFLFGVIGSLFGPIKYGILPDHLRQPELPAGNALVEGATFMAILLGTIVGGLAAKGGGDPASFAGLMMVFALLCWGASLLIPRTGAGAPDLDDLRNIARSTGALLRHLRDDQRLWWGALVTSWFWLVGAVVLSLLPPLVKTVLGGTEEVVTVYPRGLLDRDRGRLGPRRLARRPAASCSCRRWSARSLLGVFALDLGWATYGTPLAIVAGRRRRGVRLGARPPRRDRPRRARHRRRPVHRAGLRGRAGLGRRRPARPRDRRASTCSTPPSWSAARSSSRRCRRSASRRRCCSS